MDVPAWDPAAEVVPAGRPVVALAGGPAFSFVYAETTELLEAAGCEVATFDPLVDEALPEGATRLYLGGGFPEEHVAALSDNTPLLTGCPRVCAAWSTPSAPARSTWPEPSTARRCAVGCPPTAR